MGQIPDEQEETLGEQRVESLALPCNSHRNHHGPLPCSSGASQTDRILSILPGVCIDRNCIDS
jgi:hypothetical protein